MTHRRDGEAAACRGDQQARGNESHPRTSRRIYCRFERVGLSERAPDTRLQDVGRAVAHQALLESARCGNEDVVLAPAIGACREMLADITLLISEEFSIDVGVGRVAAIG